MTWKDLKKFKMKNNWQFSCFKNAFQIRPYLSGAGADRAPVLVWANTSKSSWVAGALDRVLSVLLTLSAPMSGGSDVKHVLTEHHSRHSTATGTELFLKGVFIQNKNIYTNH